MVNLLGSLGLDNVDADPNAIPDGKYDGVILRSEYVTSESKDKVLHVLTYSVTDGTHKGAQRQEFFQIGSAPRNAEGSFAKKAEDITAYTPDMSEQQKQWYKKRLLDVGVPESQIPALDVKTLEGTPVTFGVKRNNGYINVNFAERRQVTAPGAPVAPVTLTNPEGAATPAPAPTPAPAGGAIQGAL